MVLQKITSLKCNGIIEKRLGDYVITLVQICISPYLLL